MKSTEKQRGYLASLIAQSYGEYPTIDAIYEAIPKNDENHPDTRCDYRQIILTEKLSPLSIEDAGYLISWFKGYSDKFGRKLRTKRAFEILTNLKLV